MDDLTSRDAQDLSDRDFRPSQGAGNQQIPPRKAKESKDISSSNFEDCQVCGGSFKKGRGLRIHLTKSKTGCKKILESRINKSRIGVSQEQNHSGNTNGIIPVTAASIDETPEQNDEMWSIFSEYPETLSQCVGRKIRMLRFEAARIDLHDDVELEVKETIAKEERAERDILVIDDDEEQIIKDQVENEAKDLIENLEGKPVRSTRIKSAVSRPDIRDWLNNQGKSRSRVNDKPRMKMKASRKNLQKGHTPDLRNWLASNAEREEACKSNLPEILIDERANIPAEEEEVDIENKFKVIEISDGASSPDRKTGKLVGAVQKPDLRHWIISNTGNTEACKTNLPDPETLIISDEEHVEKKASHNLNREESIVVISEDDSIPNRKIEGSRPDIREWLHCQSPKKAKWSKQDKRNVDEKGEAYVTMMSTLNRGKPDDILSSNYFQLTRRDYRSLAGNNYLNDKIIDEYLQLVRQRNLIDGLKKVYPLTTHATSWLEENYDRNFPIVSRWFKEDIMDMDMLLVPVHKANHWSLVVVDLSKEVLSYYDSIYGNRKRANAPRIIKKFLEHYWRTKGKVIKLKVKIIESAPLQGNGYDCGVFVCQNAEQLARRAFVCTRQEDMPNARKTMMKEIFYGTLEAEMPSNKHDESVANRTKQFEKKETTNPKSKQSRSQIGSKKVDAKKQNEVNRKKQVKKKATQQNAKQVKTEDARKPKINWPKGNSKDWIQLDEDLTALLKILYSPPEKLAESHPRIIYEMCKERFGVKETSASQKRPSGPSKRQRKCKKLREEINQLKQTYQEAPQEEKEGINELQKEKLKKLRLAKRAESLKKSRKKFSANCKEFLGQPYQFARNLLAPKPRGELKSTKEEVEQHLKAAHSDPHQGEEREDHEDLLTYEPKDIEFNDDPPVYKEFAKKLRKTRSKSAPGPNGVPYLVYKRCPGVAKLLFNYLRLLWRRNIVSDAWRQAEGIFIPKEDGASTVEKFRTISLLNVEGKLFFSMKADRITEFLTGSGYIDPAIQKGGIPGVSGCLEHTAILSQLIREAKSEKKNLVVTWLDIANAYGSIPHDVIKKALERAHVPDNTRQLIDSYYSDVKIRFTTKEFTTEWQRLEKGIITGCTLSVILFALTMSWLVESNKKVTKGPKTSSGQRQANSRLFMDDIASTTETVPQTRYLLSSTDSKLKWAGLSARAKKCRSLVIIKGKVKKRLLKIGGEMITPIQEQPTKHLGKLYNEKLNEKDQIDCVTKTVVADLKRIDQCKLPGRYKAWIVQHMMMPRLMWPLSIYNVPLTTVEWLQQKITAMLKKWLKIPRSLSSACFYSKSTKLKLPYTSLVEEFKAAKARNLVTLQESKDECIKNAHIVVDAGKKSNTPNSVNDAKSRLRIQELVGVPNKGKEGLGMKKRQYYSTSTTKEKRDMIVKSVREKEEEDRMVKMTTLSTQGANLRWEVPQRQLKHSDMIQTSDERLRFLIKSVYDVLPTPANKNKWFNTEEKCLLCGKEGTLTHILSGCKVALCQGRYKWRHDKVLKELASSVQGKIVENTNKPEKKKSHIQFVKEGEKRQQEIEREEYHTYLSSAKDWKLTVDLDSSLKIPREICHTNLRPDLIIVSRKSKQMGIVELTVPNEDRIEVSGEIKRLKYEPIVQEGRRNGWRVKVWAVEVGCRGFPAVSMSSFFKDIGYRGSEKTRAIGRLSKAAEEASHSLWRASHFKQWCGKTSAQ